MPTGAGVIAFVVLAAIGLLVGAVIIRAAVTAHNRVVGGTASGRAIREPSFGSAMGIAAVVALSQLAVGFAIGIIAAAAAGEDGASAATVIASLAGAAVALVVLRTMLHTTWKSAGLVVLMMIAVYAVITLASMLIVWVLALATE